MDFNESAEEAEFRLKLRSWLDDNVPEAWRKREVLNGGVRDEGLARDWSRSLFEAGFVGLTWPKKFGGHDRSISFQNIYLEEMARADAPEHINIIGLGFAGPTILQWGSEGQKQALIPQILSGEEVWCQGFSEPASGSDLASASTKAVLDNDEWVVSGQKVWSSFAHMADQCILLARTETDVPKHRGLSFLLVDMKTPGISVRPLTQLTGHAEFNEMFFDEVRIPVANMLGERGDGWKVAMTTLRHERGTAAMGMAVNLQKQLQRFVELAQARGVETEAAVQETMASAWVSLQGLRYTNHRLLAAAGDDGLPGPETTVAKIAWSEANQRLTAAGLELLGRDALLNDADAPWHAYWQTEALRARGNSIEGGTSEVLLNVVAERVLGLPRTR